MKKAAANAGSLLLEMHVTGVTDWPENLIQYGGAGRRAGSVTKEMSMPKSSLSDKTTRRPKEPFDPALEDPIALTPDQLETVVGGLVNLRPTISSAPPENAADLRKFGGRPVVFGVVIQKEPPGQFDITF
jgi:hypothetical protein